MSVSSPPRASFRAILARLDLPSHLNPSDVALVMTSWQVASCRETELDNDRLVAAYLRAATVLALESNDLTGLRRAAAMDWLLSLSGEAFLELWNSDHDQPHPDEAVAPPRPPTPGELCPCGALATTVLVAGDGADLPYCGAPDGHQLRLGDAS